MQNKKILRTFAKEKRKTLNIKEISRQIRENIKNLQEYKYSRNILLYAPINNEVDVLQLFDGNKNFYLPKVNPDKKTLSVFSHKKDSVLINNFWGIPEPDTEREKQISPSALDIVVIPALMADKRGFRLGYGGGFYDRFLPFLSKNCTKIIPIPHILLYDELPYEEHDQRADYIITEKEIFQIRDL